MKQYGQNKLRKFLRAFIGIDEIYIDIKKYIFTLIDEISKINKRLEELEKRRKKDEI